MVDMTEEALKEVQRGHGGWSIRVAEVRIFGELVFINCIVWCFIIYFDKHIKAYKIHIKDILLSSPVHGILLHN